MRLSIGWRVAVLSDDCLVLWFVWRDADLSLVLTQGQHLVITGPNGIVRLKYCIWYGFQLVGVGVGKTSLFRAILGLWQSEGSGSSLRCCFSLVAHHLHYTSMYADITTPPGCIEWPAPRARVLVLPQRSFMPAGSSLAELVLWPCQSPRSRTATAAIVEPLLAEVGLGSLRTYCQTVCYWKLLTCPCVCVCE